MGFWAFGRWVLGVSPKPQRPKPKTPSEEVDWNELIERRSREEPHRAEQSAGNDDHQTCEEKEGKSLLHSLPPVPTVDL